MSALVHLTETISNRFYQQNHEHNNVKTHSENHKKYFKQTKLTVQSHSLKRNGKNRHIRKDDLPSFERTSPSVEEVTES